MKKINFVDWLAALMNFWCNLNVISGSGSALHKSHRYHHHHRCDCLRITKNVTLNAIHVTKADTNGIVIIIVIVIN